MPTGSALAPDSEATALAAALGSQYQVVRLIGRGGMGRVYLAREPFLDRQVAVKVLPAEFADTGDARERFLREARTAARLSHPNIVPLYTFGQAGSLLFFVMGYVEGESLESRLRREGRLDPEDARTIIAELADALDYAHRSGVVHRDLKPDNILLDAATGRAMLTDFGIAKQNAGPETLTRTGMIMGTPHYMSPEQAAADRTLDGRSDIYSLGVVAFRMLAGRLPFEGDNMQEVLTQHLTRPPTPLREIVPEVPSELSTAVARALAKDPAERWATARAMHSAVSGDSDEAIPDDLRGITDQGVRMFAIAAVLGLLGYGLWLYGAMNPFGAAVIAATGAFAPAAAFVGAFILRRRYGLRAVLSLWLRQPSFWAGWWPRFGRRPGDVWDRLPPTARVMRRHTTLAVLSYVPAVPFMMCMMRPSFMTAHHRWVGLLPLLIAAAFVPVVLDNFRHLRWARAVGLSKSDGLRTISEPTFSRAFWSRPEIARVLLPVTTRTKAIEASPSGPRSIARELDELALSEAASPYAELYRDAARAAHVADDEIAACDVELARLAADADPAERARIKASLDALGERVDGERAGKQEVRDLLDRQLAMFRQIEARQAEVSARRQRLVEHLRLLGLQIAHLRAQAAAVTDTAEVTGRIRQLCQSLDARISGISEVNKLLERPREPTPR